LPHATSRSWNLIPQLLSFTYSDCSHGYVCFQPCILYPPSQFVTLPSCLMLHTQGLFPRDATPFAPFNPHCLLHVLTLPTMPRLDHRHLWLPQVDFLPSVLVRRTSSLSMFLIQPSMGQTIGFTMNSLSRSSIEPLTSLPPDLRWSYM